MRIPVAEPLIGQEELANVETAVRSGWVSSLGQFIPEFEQGFADFCRTKHGVATSNGTTALHLALVALGIGHGDEVIVPDLTFIATANAVSHTGAKPVFVDSHPDYWCLDPEAITPRINSKTRAIIPVHLYGHPCDMNAIKGIARAHNLWVIEDAAEAHGAEYQGARVGNFSDIACFSFFGNKIITTGEGGICLTNDDEMAHKLRILRDHGKTPGTTYWHDVIGYNYRMTNLQAAIGVAQLRKIDVLVEKKRQAARWYAESLRCLEEREAVTLPHQMPWARSVYWMYPVLFHDGFDVTTRKVAAHLQERGIETRPLFCPMHVLPPYRSGETFAVADELSRKGLSLPGGARLDRNQVDDICACISSLYADRP